MPAELWIVVGALAVLALSVWRVVVWVQRNPRAVASQVPSPRYLRVQVVLLVTTCVVMAALLVALAVWPDVPFWFVFLEIGATLVAAELVRRLVIRRIWRCSSCGQSLPTRARRSGTNPATVQACPSCGEQVGDRRRRRRDETVATGYERR